ncbi:protein kinase family protein [Niveomyces insectorum RCEF 264]|uniref:Protein kinase family protein n=1 Tax=Niveomyces insectorum RCEF 264 TaxID=1081102 RepID=A0A168AFZ2_9HYPO|nr:protein kinase family protein [Niveomyces insectorum RCEF 264]
MDFLKSAVASAIAKGPPFPYTFGDRVDLDPSIWTLYNGTRREDGSNCSIFSFDVTANKARLPLARNALRKLRTLRHPGVIKVLDTVETDTYIYIATERVVPLRWHVKRKSLSPETLKWGLFNVARTIKFINDDATSIHGSLKVSSVYTSESGEWKLNGFEVLSNVKDDDAIIYSYGSLVPDAGRYTPPELLRSGWDAIKRSNHWAVDSFNFGVLIFEVFNGDYTGPDQAGQTKNVPPTMQTGCKRLTNANPKARISVANFLEMGQRSGSFFDSPLIKLTDGIENLGVKSEPEREQFLDDLNDLTDDFPEDFFKMKVLPELLKSVEFGGGGPKAFALVMKIGAKLSNDDFESMVTPVVLRLFANPDRAIRVCLLDNLPLMIDRFTQRIVNDKIFPQIVLKQVKPIYIDDMHSNANGPPQVSGFTDIAPVVREQTLESVLVFVPKLSDRTINGELLRYLAKTANDEQPGIRTNTTICLGKIAKNLGTSQRAKVLMAAFTRSLRDPFVHARNASLMALAATAEYFSPEDCACRILPAISPVLLDKEKLVRDQGNKTLDVFLQKIRKAAATLPDSALPPAATAGDANGVARMSTPQPGGPANAPSVPGSWAGWAISSFTNKISAAAGQIESGGSTASTPAAAAAAAAATARNDASAARSSSSTDLNRSRPTTSSASALHRQALSSPPAAQSLSRTSSNAGGDAFFSDAADDAFDTGADTAWGDLDDGFGDEGNDGEDTGAWGADSSEDASKSKQASSAAGSRTVSGSNGSSAGGVHPFGSDDAEPDFAGWLAAQEAKKKGVIAGKSLPKGLVKTGSSTSSKRPALSTTSSATKVSTSAAAAKPVAKPAAKPTAKKIDLKPKQTDETDAWDDGW